VGRYLALRIGRAALTIFGVVALVFLLVRAVPGDPVDSILGERASAAEREALRERLHLDGPLHVQFGAFLGDLTDGTLGTSFRQQDRSVRSLIGEVLGPTAVLALAALLLAWCLAIPLGTLAAARRGTRWDRAASTFAVVGLAIPNIWLGPLLILGFAVELQWLPLPGDDARGATLVLPAITLGTALAAVLTRQARASMSEVLSQHYVTTARAKGLPPAKVLGRHALRNAMLPILTVGAAQLGALLAGTVVTEKIFERQGLGTLFLEAFFARDFPVVQGCVLLMATTYVLVNLLADLVYAAVDPRVRFA